MSVAEIESDVLAACRELLAEGRYPSVRRIQDRLGGHSEGWILRARRAILERGEVAFDVRPGTSVARRRPEAPTPRGLAWATDLERAEIARRVGLVRAAKRQREALGMCPVLTGPELDAILHAAPEGRREDRS